MEKQKEIERLKALTYTDIYYEMESLKNTITELNHNLQLQQTGVSGSVFDEIYSDLTTISASLLTKKLSEFEEDWNFCKTTPKKDIYKILNNVEFQNSIQRSLANKLSSVKDKFFKHYR